MEKEWLDADANEVTSRDGLKGLATMELFFSDFRNLLNATAMKSSYRLNRCEKVASVSFLTDFVFRWRCYTVSPPRHGPAAAEPGQVSLPLF
jgi:hypothetical protein